MAVFAKFCLINFHFPHGVIVNGIAPLWDGVLWLQFAAILPSFLRWLSCWHWLSSVLGLVGGPLAYYAGERAGAVEMALNGDTPERAGVTDLIEGVWEVEEESLASCRRITDADRMTASSRCSHHLPRSFCNSQIPPSRSVTP